MFIYKYRKYICKLINVNCIEWWNINEILKESKWNGDGKQMKWRWKYDGKMKWRWKANEMAMKIWWKDEMAMESRWNGDGNMKWRWKVDEMTMESWWNGDGKKGEQKKGRGKGEIVIGNEMVMERWKAE